MQATIAARLKRSITIAMPNARPVSDRIYNCVGNHDIYESYQVGHPVFSTKARAKEMLFNHTEDWGADFADIPDSN